MFKLARPFYMLVETPLHAGSGNDLGIIDLPIQRERHTGFPKVESSSLKGCIRKAFEELKNQHGEIKAQTISLVFGPEKGDAHAGALGFTDARLLLFPVKSVRGVFAWLTCPRILNRMVNDLKLAGIKKLPEVPEESTVPKGCQLIVKDDLVVLEEYTFKVKKADSDSAPCNVMAKWLSDNVLPGSSEFNYWREKMRKDIIVLPDDDFCDFANLSTEVITRTKINYTTGTVQPSALFTEEYLPVETVLYSLALTTPIFVEKPTEKGIFGQAKVSEEQAVMDYWSAGMPGVIQLGGNATIGKGLIRIRIMGVD
ncbi:MAG: type III-B CRISPR module RAMP protein Cmr4 [Desulfotomaculaceae bacterium]|nr:type III-B CRISPR module RAMP protein Cmr4 [Desulfotomaculaceae bacterium]